jgi:glucose/arabinose dehydrogenase
VAAGFGPDPELPASHKTVMPTVNIAPAKPWQPGETPQAAAGFSVTAFAAKLDHLRWVAALPNGDVLVAESNAPSQHDENAGIKGFVMKKVQQRAGAAVTSPDRIGLVRDAEGDGVAETQTVFIARLHSPFGMALVGDQLYVADT